MRATLRHVEPDPAEQGALAEIRRLRNQGATLRGIAASLNHRALRTPWRRGRRVRVMETRRKSLGTPKTVAAHGCIRTPFGPQAATFERLLPSPRPTVTAPILSDSRLPIIGDYSTCLATLTSGLRIGTAIIKALQRPTPLVRKLERNGWFEESF